MHCCYQTGDRSDSQLTIASTQTVPSDKQPSVRFVSQNLNSSMIQLSFILSPVSESHQPSTLWPSKESPRSKVCSSIQIQMRRPDVKVTSDTVSIISSPQLSSKNFHFIAKTNFSASTNS